MRFFQVLFSLIFLSLYSGVAVASSIFTINDIKVEATGESAKKAKDVAINEAQEKAFKELLTRITPESAQASLPQLSPEQISDLVQGIDIDKESVTATHYEAVMDISFNSVLVERLLKSSSISYTDKKSNPTILIPLLVSNGEGLIWDAGNYWQEALKKALQNSSYANFVVPSGETELNVKNFSQSEPIISSQDQENISFLTRKYNAKRVLLARAVPINDNGTIGVAIETSYLNEENPQKKYIKLFAQSGDENIQQVMARAATQVISDSEKQWKEEQQQINQTKAEINFYVRINNLLDWNQIYKKLGGLDFIDNIRINYITLELVSLDILYHGDYDNFARNMAENGMYLDNKADGIFLTKRNSATSSQDFRAVEQAVQTENNFTEGQ
jgi:hypothetical protein